MAVTRESRSSSPPPPTPCDTSIFLPDAALAAITQPPSPPLYLSSSVWSTSPWDESTTSSLQFSPPRAFPPSSLSPMPSSGRITLNTMVTTNVAGRTTPTRSTPFSPPYYFARLARALGGSNTGGRRAFVDRPRRRCGPRSARPCQLEDLIDLQQSGSRRRGTGGLDAALGYGEGDHCLRSLVA